MRVLVCVCQQSVAMLALSKRPQDVAQVYQGLEGRLGGRDAQREWEKCGGS